MEELEPLLVGPTALAFVDGEPSIVAKALRDFSRTNPALVVKGGILQNKYLSDADTAMLASLPPRDVLLARVGGALVGSLQRFAWSLKALPQSLVYALAELASKQGSRESDVAEVRMETGSEVEVGQDAPPENGTGATSEPAKELSDGDTSDEGTET